MSTEVARRLRRTMTDAERRLWWNLRDRRLAGFKFRRQRPICGYVADFACLEHRLVIEADGGQHAASSGDRARTAVLERAGWRVLRFWNSDILANPEGVVLEILRVLRERE